MPGSNPTHPGGETTMPYYRVAAFDYDSTLAADGRIAERTADALQRLRAGGYRLVVVTGRLLDDFLSVCDRLELFDRAVVENGGVLYRPASGTAQPLGDRVPPALVEALGALGVEPLGVGRVVVSTTEQHEAATRQALDRLGLQRQAIRNKGALMLLPPGVDKGSGLLAALGEMGTTAAETVGVGDAENDVDFLQRCGRSVAVGNALPAVKACCDMVTRGDNGAGVVELVHVLVGEPGRLS